jgi:hypothetical protein
VDDEFWGAVFTSLSEDAGSVPEPSVSEESVAAPPELASSVTGLDVLPVVSTADGIGAVPDGSVELAVLAVLTVVVVFVSLATGTGGVLFDAVPQAPNTSVMEVRRLTQPIDRALRTENPVQVWDSQ